MLGNFERPIPSVIELTGTSLHQRGSNVLMRSSPPFGTQANPEPESHCLLWYAAKMVALRVGDFHSKLSF